MVSVTGVVRNVWKIRDSKVTATDNTSSINSNEDIDELTQFTDDGPLAKLTQKIFSLSMYSFRGDSSQKRESSAEIMLYFYDRWAEKCSFFSSGDILTLSGPARMVRSCLLVTTES